MLWAARWESRWHRLVMLLDIDLYDPQRRSERVKRRLALSLRVAPVYMRRLAQATERAGEAFAGCAGAVRAFGEACERVRLGRGRCGMERRAV